MSSQPRVSIVLPVFNAESYLGEAVESLLAQSLADFELIAIDDGSTDGSGRILEGFAVRDSRVLLVSRENRGLTATLNEGVLRATAAYVAIMNADDVALPQRLEKQSQFLDNHPRVAAVGSQTLFLADCAIAAPTTRLPKSPAAIRAFLKRACAFSHPSMMFRRQAVLNAGLYRHQIAPAEDYDLWLRLSERHDLANLPDVLLQYRLHAEQMTANRDEAFAVGTLVAQAAHRERRAGRPDPTEGPASFSLDLISRLGIPKTVVARQMLLMVLSRAEMLLAVTGSPALAFGGLQAIDGHWATVEQPQLWAACNRWLEARVAIRQGRILAAITKLLAATAADRSFTGRLASALIRRTVPIG